MKLVRSAVPALCLLALAAVVASPALAQGGDKPLKIALIDVPLPNPRDQLSTREHPAFLRLRRELYQYLGHH